MTGVIVGSELNTARLLFLNTLITSHRCECLIVTDIGPRYFPISCVGVDRGARLCKALFAFVLCCGRIS